MFREGSNVAIRILDNIAVEAAGLAYKELRFVSEELRKETLWLGFSSPSLAAKQPIPSREAMEEMLSLSCVRPLSQLDGNGLTDSLPELQMLLGDESEINWSACCKCMKKDQQLFSPHWSLVESLPPHQHHQGAATHLFYMQDEDLFLLLTVSSLSKTTDTTPTRSSSTSATARGKLIGASLVEKDDFVKLDERRHMALQKFANFLLHYVWQNL